MFSARSRSRATSSSRFTAIFSRASLLVKGKARLCSSPIRRIEEEGVNSLRCISTVLDVGANTGQFAGEIHAILPDAAIYSFEPLLLVEKMSHLPKFRAFDFAGLRLHLLAPRASSAPLSRAI